MPARAAATDPVSTAPGPGVEELFRSVGGAIHRRLAEVAGDDEVRTRADAQVLFVRFYVRFVVRRAADLRDDAVRWAWIYRVATIHGLRSLADGARPGQRAAPLGSGPASAPSGPSPPLPTMQALRAFDEATQAIVVLAWLDRLSAPEIAEVLELSPDLVRRRLAEARRKGLEIPAAAVTPGGTEQAAHPSRFALDRDRDRPGPPVAVHLTTCAACRDAAQLAGRVAAAFAPSVTAEEVEGVARAVRVEKARLAAGPRWKRIFWLGGALVVITVMAFAVARPHDPKPNELPFRGNGSASRARAAGLEITSRRGSDVGVLAPGMFSRIGDQLHFRVRAEGPRYLEVRVRGPKDKLRLYPASGSVAARVVPGQALDRDYVIDAPVALRGRWLVIEGLFSEHEFALDQPPGRDVEVVPARIDVER
jgi:DNA-directed RNA polymerase specialized sigma24 family protein